MKGLDAYKLKWMAIIGMFVCHIYHLRSALPIPAWSQYLIYAAGGLTFPIMAFLAAEGYRHTSSVKKYLLRIFLFALAAQVPYMLVRQGKWYSLNILFTIALGILLLVLYDRIKRKVLFWFIFVAAIILSATMDWPVSGPAMIVMYRLIPGERLRRILPALVFAAFNLILVLFVWAFASRMFWELLSFSLVSSASVFLILRYNGERGRPMKYFFYAFYPLHFVVLWGIALALGVVKLPFA